MEALKYLSGVVARWSRRPPSDLQSACRAIARDLRATQPSMGVFAEWSIEWNELSRTASSDALLRELRRWQRAWDVRLRHEGNRLVRVARLRFPSTGSVMTISRSESVRRSIVGIPRRRRPCLVLVLESRPGGEGRSQAQDLDRGGVLARVVPDEDGAALARLVDLVLLGADAIYTNGSVVHKVGTRRLALAAHRSGTPVVVVSGRSKEVRRSRPAIPPGPLFDVTPASSISEYWTDTGWVRHGRWGASPPRL